jgi:hypothetical protein
VKSYNIEFSLLGRHYVTLEDIPEEEKDGLLKSIQDGIDKRAGITMRLHKINKIIVVNAEHIVAVEIREKESV